jgi:hypothetical protein
MAMQFATELRSAAKQTGNLGERSLNDLRDILTDTLAKVRAEVFPDAGPGTKTTDTGDTGAARGESDAEAAGNPADADDKPRG